MTPRELPPLPESPGVYFWKVDDHIIYIGKAKSLKHRVGSYFHGEGKSFTISQQANNLEFIVVRDEIEALMLEANLIKKYRPHYNVLLKDDKHYPFLKLTQETFPQLLVTRRLQQDGARYWGPFPDSGAIRRIKHLIDRSFTLRKNSGQPFKTRKKPCLNASIGRCKAPCVSGIDPATYAQTVQDVQALLDGNIGDLYATLEGRMHTAAKQQDFERAAEIRDQIKAVQIFFGSTQQAYDAELGDLDFLGMARAGEYLTIQLYQMRSGQILGRVAHFAEGMAQHNDSEIMDAFLRDYYLEATPLPPLILLPFDTTDQQLLAETLSAKGRKIEVRTPKRGDKSRLLELSQKNAQTALETELKIRERKGDHPGLIGLMQVLRLNARPFRVEGYDISNLQSESIVGSITVFEGGKPKKAEYRRMKIKYLDHPDDYYAMEQTITRRFSGSLSNMPVPDVLLIDGGIGQVRAAAKALHTVGLSIPLVGLAKREETLILLSGEAVQLPLTDPTMQMLIFQRDETHNNGLNYNRSLRTRKALKSIFDDIPGVGPARKQALMMNFSTLEDLKSMTVERLSQVPGIDRRTAESVLRYLNSQQAN